MQLGIIGTGSIGQRHLRLMYNNLKDKYNLEFSIADVSAARLNLLKREYPEIIRITKDYKELLKDRSIDVIFICTPNSMHLENFMDSLQAGKNIFIEKPLSHIDFNVNSVNDLIFPGMKIMIGYNLRFNSIIQEIVKLIKNKTVGDILHASIICGQFLPDWHPNADYRKEYSANKNLGGGVILDISHEIDYALYLFGKPKSLTAIYDKVSNLEIDTEDSADILWQTETNTIINIHIDYLQRFPRREIYIIGSEGHIKGDIKNNFIEYQQVGSTPIRNVFDETVDTMYIKELDYFLDAVYNDKKIVKNSLEDAYETLKISLDIKKKGKF